MGNMTNVIKIGNLQVDAELADFVNRELLTKISRDEAEFWSGFEEIIFEFSPRNSKLLIEREQLQEKIDNWHRERRAEKHNAAEYKQFLIDIDYLEDEGGDFEISTTNVDTEIAKQAGPQLVVPVKNARFALNAATRDGVVCMMLFTVQMLYLRKADARDRAGTTRSAAIK